MASGVTVTSLLQVLLRAATMAPVRVTKEIMGKATAEVSADT